MKTKTKILTAQILAKALIFTRFLSGRGPVLITKRGGSSWELDLREGIDLSLFLGLYERATTKCLQRSVNAGDVAIDIGANIGAQTLPLAHSVGATGRVFAVEATDFAFAKLNRNIELNPDLKARVTAIQAILTDEPGRAPREIYSSWPVAGPGVGQRHGVHLGVAKHTSGAQALSLDGLVDLYGLPRIDLIKLDVDGNELSVLRSAQKTLRRFRPKMVIEFAPYLHRDHGGGFGELLDFIANARYALFRTDGITPVEMTPSAFDAIVDEGSSIDLVAHPLHH